MKIIVQSENTNLRIPVPSALVFSDVSALFLPKIMAPNGITVTRKQAIKLCRAIRKCKRRHPNFTLVEAETANGDRVEIKL